MKKKYKYDGWSMKDVQTKLQQLEEARRKVFQLLWELDHTVTVGVCAEIDKEIDKLKRKEERLKNKQEEEQANKKKPRK